MIAFAAPSTSATFPSAFTFAESGVRGRRGNFGSDSPDFFKRYLSTLTMAQVVIVAISGFGDAAVSRNGVRFTEGIGGPNCITV